MNQKYQTYKVQVKTKDIRTAWIDWFMSKLCVKFSIFKGKIFLDAINEELEHHFVSRDWNLTRNG